MLQKVVPVLFVLMCAAFVLLPKLLLPPAHSLQGLPNIRYQDTICIQVEYAGCGEWGGHREMIKVYQEEVDHREIGYEEMINTKRPFLAEYWVDSTECSYRTDRKFLLHKRQILTSSQEATVLRYIQDFVPASLQARQFHDMMDGNGYVVYLPVLGEESVVLSFSSSGKDIFQELHGKMFKK
ncbi:hypothetical protein [Hymenobacter sp. BT190]|uniref:hypothetical protein n=1 Tax=Hymenobacter sp. BT190 TaxID=2763505 RepID=UPI0016519765|nr:hypothetical protein [Hymenobacter sp. BT190]MBC6697983.1 hypothetical protein [Hymenobacter sp. BT190]